LVNPIVPPGQSFTWMFVANFDHPKSATKSTGCLATRQSGQVTQYQVGDYCTVMNNTANVKFGGGTAPFDGNAYLQCAITIPGNHAPPQFWTHARPNIPTTIQGATYTLISSSDITFTAQTDPLCVVTLSSQYDDIAFAHATLPACGSFVRVDSHLNQSIQPPLGTHFVGGMAFGPTQGSGSFALPANFSFQIGAAGQIFALDWLVLDPPGGCCRPG
jgi:hypothetical protein